MKPRLAAFSSPSFALISVLALVSLAALTATAFLASARLDRQATRSLGETARLEMACVSASACARQTLNVMCQKSWQILPTYWRGTNATDWTNELGYLLIGYPNAANARWAYTCGFNPAIHKKLDTSVFKIEGINTNPGSYLSEIGSFMVTLTNGFVTNPTSTNTNCTLIPLLGGRTSPPVGWTYIYQDKKIANSTNTTNVPIARFSYYMEDLTGLIDAERMGGTNRTTGTNALEISLTNLTTNWSSSSILNAANYNQFINPTNRAKYFSPGMMLYAGGLSTNDLRYFAHGLLSWDSFPNTIPMGIAISNSKGYANANTTTLKVNLNSSANLNVSTIATAINANLPGFINRAGGMSSTAYVNNIAANIVDYIDTDSIPSTDSATSPTYVGIENIPWPNELFDTLFIKNVVNGPPPQIRLQLKDFVEVWNMGNKTIPTGTSISISNNYDMLLTFTNSFITPSVGFKINLKDTVDVDNGNVTNWTRYRTFTTTSPILPNGYAVLEASKSISGNSHFTLGVNLTNPAWASTNPTAKTSWFMYTPSTDRTDKMTYSARFGTNVIQKSRGGRWPHYLAVSFKIDSVSGNQFVFCNPIGYASQTSGTGVPAHSGGDPRAQYFLSNALRVQNYIPTSQYPNSFASPGGRNIERDNYLSKGFPESEINPAKYWPDQGHATTNDWGSSATSYNDGPLSFSKPSTSAQTNNWVMACRPTNQTGLVSLTELGRIYDPMQWSDQSGSGVSGQPGLWTNLTAAASPDARFGGRNTLRIGRPEFTRFAFTNLGGTSPVPNMGLSSVALLDIFSLFDSYDNGGRINLNTAPAPVLRALAGGVTLTNDSGLKPSSTLTVPTKMTEAFAQGVMRYRATYPFLSPSQLAFIATDYGATNGANHWTNTWPKNAVFGNTNASILLTNAPGNTLGTTASMGVSEWNDQAAEEWFSKIYNLSTVQSWNYRVYVVAQLVNTNGLPTGPSMRKYSLMYVRYTGTFPSLAAGPYISFESQY